jgi:O-antigen/teichoic acid export membrane protein
MKAAGLAITIVVARALHADGFGRFASAWSYGMLVGVLADFGLAYFVALEVSRVPRTARRFVWTALALRSAVCVLGLGLAVLALPWLHFDAPLAVAAIAFTVSAIFDGLTTQATAYYRAVARMHVEAAIVSFGRVALIVCTALALVHVSVFSFALAQALASAATFVVACRSLSRDVSPSWPRWRAVRAIGRGALPFAASGLLSYVFFRIDTLLLRAFGIADVSIGAYSAAYRVMEAPRTAFGSIAAGVIPAATALAHPSERAAFRKLGVTSTSIVLWMVVPAVLAFALAPNTVVRLIFGRGYDQAGILLMILAPMPILMALDAVLGSLLNALGLQTRVTGVFALCAIANVALNVWLIPREGAVGAAIATVATELVELTAFAMLVQARLGSVRPALAGLTAAALAGVGAGSFFPDGIARIAASVGAFATVAFVVKRRDLVFA